MATTPTESLSPTDDDQAHIIEQQKRERANELRELEQAQMRWARLHPVERGLIYFVYFFLPILAIAMAFIPSMHSLDVALFLTYFALFVVGPLWAWWRARQGDAAADRRRLP